MFCGQCGHRARDGDGFCRACGQTLPTVESQQHTTAEPPDHPNRTVDTGQAHGGDAVSEPARRSVPWAVVASVIIVLVVLVGGGIFWLVLSNDVRPEASSGGTVATGENVPRESASPSASEAPSGNPEPIAADSVKAFLLPDGVVAGVSLTSDTLVWVESFPADIPTLPLDSDLPLCFYGTRSTEPGAPEGFTVLGQESPYVVGDTDEGSWRVGIGPVAGSDTDVLYRYGATDVAAAPSVGGGNTEVISGFGNGEIQTSSIGTLVQNCYAYFQGR